MNPVNINYTDKILTERFVTIQFCLVNVETRRSDNDRLVCEQNAQILTVLSVYYEHWLTKKG